MKPQANQTKGYKEIAPSAGRLAAAIAGYPYTPRAAILDIVDNSCEAAADRIAILLEQRGKALHRFAIVDNGTGISPLILDEVLRVGSATSHLYNEGSLSRYGIGLKGAGFSLGNKVSIITRIEGQPLMRRAIDREHIQQTDKWEQEIREPNAAEVAAFEASMAQLSPGGQRESGTLVLIEDLNIRLPDITRLKNDLVRRLGETYGKFLRGGGSSILQIKVLDGWSLEESKSQLGTMIEPVDPLHREDPGTVVLYPREEIKLEDGSSVFFSVAVLPHSNAVSAETKRNYRYGTDAQGIYVYRNGRLLRGGQTLGMFTKESHLNAFRAELEYTSSADEHVLVDVAKSHVTLTQEAHSRLQEIVAVATKTAQIMWREKDVLTIEGIKGLFDESNRSIASRYRLIVDLAKKRREQREKTEDVALTKSEGTKPGKVKDIAFLCPVNHLPEGVLYRPRFDPKVRALVVDVNLEHAFSKAVFTIPPGDPKRSVPRKATTAAQHMLYLLGHTEDSLNNHDKNRELLEQFRRVLSLNLQALLAD